MMPPLNFKEVIEPTKIFSVVGRPEKEQALVTRKPFRSSLHTISGARQIGGNQLRGPRETSLVRNGVLSLDEFPKFKKQVLEVLRQALEDLKVTISRAASAVSLNLSTGNQWIAVLKV